MLRQPVTERGGENRTSTSRARRAGWSHGVGRVLVAAGLLSGAGACSDRSAPVGVSLPVPADSGAGATGDGTGSLSAEALYLRHCAACHGVEGHGDGPAAEQLYPKPRAFRDSPFRFMPAGGTGRLGVSALAATIGRGVPRSSMPGFAGVLTVQEIDALAGHVASMAGVVGVGPASATSGPSEKPDFSPWLIEQGRLLYRTQACINCHGATGRGDGEASLGLVDAMGRPVRPGDLGSGLYKSGTSPYDLYRTISQGVPGTPMMGYGPLLIETLPSGGFNDQKVWALVAYVRSLAPADMDLALASLGEASGAEIPIAAAPTPSMLDDPSDEAWLGASRNRVTVRPLWQRVEGGQSITVSAVRTSARIAITLAWDDPSCDVGVDTGVFPDAVAIMFAMGDEVPSLPMALSLPGENPEAPVNIWQWKASRQYDASAGRAHDAEGPRELPADSYHHFGPPPTPVSSEEPGGGQTAVDQDLEVNRRANATSEAAGNVHTNPALSDRSVLEANALGFGTLTYQGADDQDVSATAVWSNGRWFVTLARAIEPGQGSDIDFSRPGRIAVALAVWDGARGDRDGIKHISSWHWLVGSR